MELEATDDANQFLGSVDGSTTAVIIAKDLCSNRKCEIWNWLSIKSNTYLL